MLLPCVIAMDKTTIDMAGRINMEPITVSHGLLNHDICRLPIAMRILGYIHHSTPPHLPSGANVDSEFNAPVELPDDVVRVKNPIHRPANGNVSWATLLLNKTHMQIQFILKESGFLREKQWLQMEFAVQQHHSQSGVPPVCTFHCWRYRGSRPSLRPLHSKIYGGQTALPNL